MENVDDYREGQGHTLQGRTSIPELIQRVEKPTVGLSRGNFVRHSLINETAEQ